MKVTIGDDQSTCTVTYACSSLNKRYTSTIIKVCISIVLVAVISIIGWQIHDIIGAKNDNQSSKSSFRVNVIETNYNESSTSPPTVSATLSPTPKPTIISDQRLKYLSKFSHSPNSTYSDLRTYLPIWKKRILQMDSEIKLFMDQKRAIQKLSRKIKLTERCQHEPFYQWYSFVLKSKPRIDTDNITNTIRWKIDSFDYKDICHTNNGLITYLKVHVTACSGFLDFTSLPDSLTVFEIPLQGSLHGPVNLTSLPDSLRELTVNCYGTEEPIDLTSLPPFLTKLHFEYNDFEGSIDLSSLPDSLQELSLNRNQLSGSVDLAPLRHHPNLKILSLQENKFNGSIDLTMLPNNGRFEAARLRANKFTGTVDLTSLPQSLKELELFSNRLTGTINLTSLPTNLETLDLGLNKLNGTVDLTSLPPSIKEIFLPKNKFTGSVDMTKLPHSLNGLYLWRNRLSGTVDLTKVPPSVNVLRLEYNRFTGIANLTKLRVFPWVLEDVVKGNKFDPIIVPKGAQINITSIMQTNSKTHSKTETDSDSDDEFWKLWK